MSIILAQTQMSEMLQIGSFVVGSNLVVVWIARKILKRETARLLFHPNDKKCHVDAEEVKRHLQDMEIHVARGDDYVKIELFDAKMSGVENRMVAVETYIKDVLHKDIREIRSDIQKDIREIRSDVQSILTILAKRP